MNKQITTTIIHPPIRKLHTSNIRHKNNNNKQINQSAATIINHNDNPSKKNYQLPVQYPKQKICSYK